MKRNNGYLELKIDSKIDDLIKMGVIDFLKRNKVCFYINSLKLFFKEESTCYQELVGSKIANLLNIDSVNYDMVRFITEDRDYYGVVSEDFRNKDYKLITISEIIDKYILDNNIKILYNDMSLDLINEAVKYRYSNYVNKDDIINKIMDDIKKSFLFDILIGNIDNGKYNYELMESDTDSKITPYFDYEQIFKFSSTRLTVNDSDNYDVYDNLLLFLNDNSSYIKYFMEMYKVLNPDKVMELFIEVENDTNSEIDDNYKNIVFLTYSRHYLNIGKVLDKIKYKSISK